MNLITSKRSERTASGSEVADMEVLTRESTRHAVADLARSETSIDGNRVSLTFSSETPVRLWGEVYEILNHKRGCVRLDRLRAGSAPLLYNHASWSQIGVIESVDIRKRRGHATVRFSENNDEAQRILADIRDGIISNVSVGYRVFKIELDREEDDGETRFYRSDDWEPYEISIVTLPADLSVGINRGFRALDLGDLATSGKARENQQKTEEEKDMSTRSAAPAQAPENSAPPATQTTERRSEPQNPPRAEVTEDQRRAIAQAEQSRINTITDLSARLGLPDDLRQRAINETWELDRFRETAMSHLAENNAQPNRIAGVPVPDSTATNFLNRRELQHYRIGNVARSLLNNRPLEGLEREASDECARLIGYDNGHPFVPWQALMSDMPGYERSRTMLAGTSTQAGALIDDDLQEDLLIPLLENNTVVGSLGAMVMSGLTSDVSIPRETDGIAGTWGTEVQTTSEDDAALDQVQLTPNRLRALSRMSRQALMQTSGGIEQRLRNRLRRGIVIAYDLAALVGSGSSGQPTGVFEIGTGLNEVTFGGVADIEAVNDFERLVAEDNALQGDAAFVTSPGVRSKWKSIEAFTGTTGETLWGRDNRISGYRAESTTQLSSGTHANKIVFGVWESLILAQFGAGLEILVDQYSQMEQSIVRIYGEMFGDIGIEHPESFCVSTDTANQ